MHYLDEDDNQLLPSITAEGYFVEVTEIFKPVDGHETDTYSITKVLSTSESNDIVFRYKRTQANATANSPYRVSAYMQDLDDLQHYTELKKKDVCPVEYTAEVGSKPTVNPFLFDGFVLVKAVVKGTNTTLTIKDGVVTGAVLPKEGMEICLYYDRVELSYTVEYHYQYTTSDGQTLTQELIPSETRKGMFGEKIEVAALDLTGIGYGLVSSPTAEVTLNSVATQERIIFVYSENNVVFRYYSVLGKNGTVLSGSETIRAFKGTSEGAAGFLPENTQDYTFVGWYLDERCSFPVTTSDRVLLEDSGKLTPQAVTKTVNGREYLVYEPATYYALYEPNNSKLIIDVVQTTGVSMDQTFLYRIQGTDTNNTHIDLTVAIHGTYIAPVLEIPVGTYKVTEISDWSWRYTPDAIEKTVYVTVDDTRLNFTYTVAEDQWLSGEGFEHYVVPPPAS